MRLPNSVQEIADVIGRERALLLIGKLPRCYTRDSRYPGAKTTHIMLYVPKRLPPDHDLVKIIGWRDAFKLVQAFGGEFLYPAGCAAIYRDFRDSAILRLIRNDFMQVKMVADWFCVSERHVRNLLREIPQVGFMAGNINNPLVKNYAKANQ